MNRKEEQHRKTAGASVGATVVSSGRLPGDLSSRSQEYVCGYGGVEGGKSEVLRLRILKPSSILLCPLPAHRECLECDELISSGLPPHLAESPGRGCFATLHFLESISGRWGMIPMAAGTEGVWGSGRAHGLYAKAMGKTRCFVAELSCDSKDTGPAMPRGFPAASRRAG